MPQIHYGGIDLTPISDFQLVYETVTDPSQIDYLFDAVHIGGTFVVNGQSEIRALDDPPVSLTEEGGTSLRTDDDITKRPPGMVFPGVGNLDTDGPERQRGAVADFTPIFNQVYTATDFPSPAYSVENLRVTKVKVEAGPNSVTLPLLQERLKQPRGQLVVYEGTGQPHEIILHSPGWGYVCDAKGGPIPQLLDLTWAQGDGVTYFVSWSCVTYLRQRRRSYENDPLLSNRWKMTHHIRQGGFTDYEVEGTAIFDLGIIHKMGVHADSYRPKLFLPIPAFYERKDMIVQANEDGSMVHYKYLDEQKEINFPASVYVDAVDIESEHRQYVIGDDNVLTGVLGAVDSTLNLKWMWNSIRDNKRQEADSLGVMGRPNHPFPPMPPPSIPPTP